MVGAWRQALATHPDTVFASYIVSGLSRGFWIGYDYNKAKARRSRKNMKTARANAAVIDSYLQEECAAARISCPDERRAAEAHISPMGVIPKAHQPGRWRLIVDLSSPRAASVNDGIAPNLCSLSYVSIDVAARKICELGTGAMMAKLDIQSAYRHIPVHPDDRHLLGISWKGKVYLDRALPFGLRSAPKIFSAVAYALMWIMSCQGLTAGIHYLDDFLFFGRPQASECDENLAKALSICNELGVPVATNKLEGPTTCLTFLGLQLDSQDGIISLPAVKLQKVKSTIAEWLTRRACTKRRLLSLIGTLHHATSVVKAGRAFLRRLIDLAGTVKQLHYWVRINSEARADLRWWDAFLESWNGKSIINTLVSRPPAIQLTSDASGSWGCGAIWRCNWFQWKWSRKWEEISIAPKELLPILLASAT